MGKHERFYVHSFFDLEDPSFSAVEYSKLKFGNDAAAKKLGHELAVGFFHTHIDKLLANQCVVIPSPYNVIKNAATVMTDHFCNKLNEMLVQANGTHVDCSIIHRKVSYTNDYGFLSKDKRKSLIDNDSFYLNRDFTEGKTLIFIDDVRITGTHEDKLVEILKRDGIDNDVFFLYYANYYGNSPDVEAKLNFAAVRDIYDYLELAKEPHHHTIIRPMKYILSQTPSTVKAILPVMETRAVQDLYWGCLGEGYYKIPSYHDNFQIIAAEFADREERQ
jgi:predicted amidophosphoribosyltransferase